MVGEVPAQAMRSTDWFGVGKVIDSIVSNLNEPLLTYTRTDHKAKYNAELKMQLSKLDGIVGIAVLTLLYIAMKEHLSGRSGSAFLLGLGNNLFGGQSITGIPSSTSSAVTGSLFSGLPGDAGLISAPYRWFKASEMLGGIFNG